MDDYQRERARTWLRTRRGSVSQADLAADITASTGWTITRDRYSKYESGAVPFGLSVLTRFVLYWESKGEAGPDFTPPVPQPTPEAEMAAAIVALTTELRAWREERETIETRLRAAEAELRSLRDERAAAGSPGQSAPRATAGSVP